MKKPYKRIQKTQFNMRKLLCRGWFNKVSDLQVRLRFKLAFLRAKSANFLTKSFSNMRFKKFPMPTLNCIRILYIGKPEPNLPDIKNMLSCIF